jgi:hypothetical protein
MKILDALPAATAEPTQESPPRVEAPEFGKMVRRMIKAYGRRCANADVEDLADLMSLRDELERSIEYAVHESRVRHGRSWADIGRACGTSRQAAQQRYERPEVQTVA